VGVVKEDELRLTATSSEQCIHNLARHSMDESIQGFYDDLADDYQTVYVDWAASVRRQAQALDRIIESVLGHGTRRVLDCSCGVGTQSLGLAQLGHAVRGTDVSGESVRRAKNLATEMGLKVDFSVADMRSLRNAVPGSYEVVISCDNSLPHLLSTEDLVEAATNIRSKLLPKGLFIASTRDYDALLLERPVVSPPTLTGVDGTRRVVFQVWDWTEDGRCYRMNHMTCREEAGTWTLRHRSAWYRAWTRAEITQVLEGSGFDDVRWLDTKETSYFQPIVVASRKD